MFFHRDYSPEEKRPFADSLARYRSKKEKKKKNKIAGARFRGLLDNRGNKQSAPITFEPFLRSSACKTRYSRITLSSIPKNQLFLSNVDLDLSFFWTRIFSVVKKVPNYTEIIL